MKFNSVSHLKNVPTSGTNTVYVKLDMEPDQIKSNRAPMRLACVFDRSGSMQGQKIEYAKEAAKMLVRQLSSADIFCMVAFDDHVMVLVEPSSVESKEELQQSIDKLHVGGWTDMGSGLIKAFELMKGQKSITGVNRLLLLSDGHANQGLVGEPLVNRVAVEVEKTGFSVSAFGIGADYDSALLGRITAKGQGSLYHIDSPDATPRFFQEQFGDLLSVSATGTKVKVTVPTGVVVKEFYGFTSEDNTYEIGNLYTGETRSILMELEVDSDQLTEGPIEIGLDFNGYNLDGDEFSMTQTLKIDTNNDEPVVDFEIAAFADKIRQAFYVQKASEASMGGDWSGASVLLSSFVPTYEWSSYAAAGVMSTGDAELFESIQVNALAEATSAGAHTNYSTNSVLSYAGNAWAANTVRGRGMTTKGAMRMAEMKLSDEDDDEADNK